MGRWRLPLLGLVLGPLLVGCMSLAAELEIGEDETVQFRIVASAPRQLFAAKEAATGVDLCDNLLLWLPADTVVEPTDTAKDLICRASGQSATRDLGRHWGGTVSTTGGARSGLIIVRGDGQYTFVWAPMSGARAEDVMAELEFTVTFPGPVTEHTGTASVWLNSITWRDPEDLFAIGGISARGEDRPGPLLTLLPYVVTAAGLAALWLAGSAVRAWAARRRAEPAVPPETEESLEGESPWAPPN